MTFDDRDTVAELLDARARTLARPVASTDPGSDRDLLVASIGDARLAVDMRRVKEVLGPGPLARLPGAGHGLVGLRNVGGELVAIAEIASLLGLAHDVGAAERWVVVIDDAHGSLGVQVDRAEALVTIADDSLRPAPTSEAIPATGVIAQLTPDGALVLDVDALLAQPLSVRPDRIHADQEEPHE